MSNVVIDDVSATVSDPPATRSAAPAAAGGQDPDRQRDYDRLRLDDLLRLRAQRDLRASAD